MPLPERAPNVSLHVFVCESEEMQLTLYRGKGGKSNILKVSKAL